jgi:transposase
VIRRYELSDVEWVALEPFLPGVVTGGRPRADDRRLLNGIVWKIRSGAAWRDIPARYGSWQSVYTRFRRWALDGTFAAMLAGVQADADAAGDIDWLVSVDSTIVRAHQHAAGARGAVKGGAKKRAKYRITPLGDPEED